MKRAATVFASVCTALLAILVAPRIATRVLFSTVSPRQRYKVEVSQYRPFPFDERAVFLNVYRDGRTRTVHKLLYTGDFLDDDFRDLYPNPRFRSEDIYELGDVMNDGSTSRPGTLRIVNATQKEISYLLIETGWYKLVVLDLKAGATADLNFQYAGGLSCQARFADSRSASAELSWVNQACGQATVARQIDPIPSMNGYTSSRNFRLAATFVANRWPEKRHST